MNAETVFSNDFWDSAAPMPPRSRLYHLEPVGAGTPHVESLTGYVARLAEAHRVTVFLLFKHVIDPLDDKIYAFHQHAGILPNPAKALNGTGVGAERTVRILETLTMRSDLRPLTLLPWSTSLSHLYLFKKERVWCPLCYEEWRVAEGIIYEPLIWMLKPVEICIRHRVRFRSDCPRCGRTQRWLTNRSRPGHCSACGDWLGEAQLNPDRNAPDADDSGYEYWAAESIGTMLSTSSSLTARPTKDTAFVSLLKCMEAEAGGEKNAFAAWAGVKSMDVRGWMRGAQPQLSTILKICHRAGLRLVDFLAGEVYREDVAVKGNVQAQTRLPANRYQILNMGPFWSRVGEYLASVLRDKEMPPSIDEIAREHGLYRGQLYGYFPDLCRAITTRRREEQIKSEEELLKNALKMRPPRPLNKISKEMGFASSSQLRKRHPELCKAVSERFETYKRGQLAKKNNGRLAEVRRVALMLHREGIYPSFPKVSAGLFMPSIMALEAARNMLREVQKELGYRK